MNKSDLIILDIDDVVVDMKTYLIQCFNAEYDKDLTVKDWNDFNIGNLYGITQSEINEVFYKYEMITKARPFNYASKIIKNLKRKFDVICVSSRGWHSEAKEITSEYFDRFKIDIPYNDIHIVNSLKGEYLKNNNISAKYFLDDNADHIRSVFESGMVDKCFIKTEYWNTHFKTKNRVHSLVEFAYMIEDNDRN